MDAPPPVVDSAAAAAPPPPLASNGGGARRFSLGGSLRLPGLDEVKAGASRLVDQVSSELSGVFDRPGEHGGEECPAVLLEPEPEDLAGWERRARSLEGHWRSGAETVRALRANAAAQQGEADMAQAYAAQVAALEAEVGVLQRNEQAMRQRQLLAQHTSADEQGEIIKLLQTELRDMQLQLRAVARQSREERLSTEEDARLSSEEATGKAPQEAAVAAGAAAVAQVSAFEATEEVEMAAPAAANTMAAAVPAPPCAPE